MNIMDQLQAQMRGMPSEPLPENTLVMDVRSPAEFQMGHVDGAINLPVEAIAPQNLTALTDKARPIVVYCASGMRSAYARSMLMQLGFMQVVNGGTPHETAQLVGKSLVR